MGDKLINGGGKREEEKQGRNLVITQREAERHRFEPVTRKQTCWHQSAMQLLRRLRQKDHHFKISLGNSARDSKKPKKRKSHTQAFNHSTREADLCQLGLPSEF